MFVTGLSMAMMSTIYSIGSVILQSSINALGSVYIAAQVGGRRLVELFMMPGGACLPAALPLPVRTLELEREEGLPKE